MDTKTLNRKRGNIKGQLTRLQNFIKTEMKDADCFVIENKLETVRNIRSKLESLRDEYYLCLDDDDSSLPELEENICQLEDQAEDIQVGLKRFIADMESKNCSSTVKSGKSNDVRLPEIPMPTFSGKYDEWNLFKEQFTSLIENNKSLSDKQKLYYLQSALIGKAKHIQTTDDSYESLMKALTERFDNKRLIVFNHIYDFLAIDKMKYESAKELRYLIDQVLKHLRALKQMNLTANQLSEVLLIGIISQKIDTETRKNYEMTLSNTELPSWDNFLDFLQKRCQILENLQNKESYTKTKVLNRSKNFLANSTIVNCLVCKNPDHKIFKCPEFLSMDQKKRFEFVKRSSLCINCLGFHKLATCTSKYRCKFCSMKHSSLLHVDKTRPDVQSRNEIPATTEDAPMLPLTPQNKIENQNDDSVCASVRIESGVRIGKGLLPTAVIWVKNGSNKLIKARAVLDSGSEHCFISTYCSDRLNVNKQRVNYSVNGINNTSTSIKSKVIVDICNCEGDFVRNLEMFVVPKVTGILPSKKFDISNCNLPHHIKLADPTCATPGNVDILLGAGIFFDLLKPDKIVLDHNKHIILQNTVFGYIVTGMVHSENVVNSHCGLLTENEDLNNTLKLFWEIEKFPDTDLVKGKEEKLCEEHFLNTHSRDLTGRYVVQMPLKKDPECLGKSRAVALNKLNSMWKRLDRDPDLLALYRNFLHEYLSLGHMEEVKEDVEPEVTYYLPHHGVYRPDKLSTPLRVVFNASSVTSSGESLNSLQYVGGVIQDDLFSILLRFRKNKFAFTADIKKMFRMISIHDSQKDLLRILWKDNVSDRIITYRLTTVTYGTASAPFLATRTLKQLAFDEGAEFPLASSVTHSDVYMDDILTGSQDLETAQNIQHQLTSMLKRGGMILHKWTSNSPHLFNNSIQPNPERHLSFDDNSSVKTLGLSWNYRDDQFLFKVDLKESLTYSKRDVLSVIARLYDPLGLIGPVISKAKIFLQILWLQRVSWEDAISPELATEWKHFLTSLKSIEELRIPRWILVDNYRNVVLHCFADASEKAYGAVVYIQCIDQNSTAHASLVTSKSRVAPIKTISVPRLELCACLLASKLMLKVREALKISIDRIVLYTDSSICLAWIRTPSYQMKSFVANRVTKIQDLTENCLWMHVPSTINPADILSRGANPCDLLSSNLWWHGPTFLQYAGGVQLQQDADNFEHDPSYVSELKHKKSVNLVATKMDGESLTVINDCSSFSKLLRTIGWCLRFIKNSREPSNKTSGCLTSTELAQALTSIVKNVQAISFTEEIKCLEKGRPLPNNSKLLSLSPFLDPKGILRVGGRLKNSNLPMDQKHQILIPNNHNLSNLIINYFHALYFHTGHEHTLYLTRTKFWILGARSLIRKICKNCMTCRKVSSLGTQQLMADLPAARVSLPPYPKAFNQVGVDYCGPFIVKEGVGKGRKTKKCYCSLFICLTVKAIHIEIVSDLTSEAFIAAFRRFVARRGRPVEMFSDNGTNFIGANNEMRRILKSLFLPDNKEKIENYLAKEGIKWHFNPPAAPHFGGLWEAGVKSLKSHDIV